METSDKKVLTCLVKDDVSNFFLLYRKLASTNFDVIGINTAYNRQDQKFLIDQELTSLFPKIAYLGPTPMYEEYVTMANFPRNSDLNIYQDNIININIIEHLKEYPLHSIFPKQITRYHHPMNVKEELFYSAQKQVDKNYINIAINIFDPAYDKDIVLQYDVTYCINTIIKAFPEKKIKTHLVGIVHPVLTESISRTINETFQPLNTEIVNWLDKSLSEQLAVLLSSNLLISGSYGLGFLAYTARIPSFIIYPFQLEYMVGKTIDQRDDNSWYIETTDANLFVDINQTINLIKENLPK